MGKVVALKPRSGFSGKAQTHDILAGMPVFAGNGIGILDGGVPHYGFGGAISLDEVKIGDPRVSWRRKDRDVWQKGSPTAFRVLIPGHFRSNWKNFP